MKNLARIIKPFVLSGFIFIFIFTASGYAGEIVGREGLQRISKEMIDNISGQKGNLTDSGITNASAGLPYKEGEVLVKYRDSVPSEEMVREILNAEYGAAVTMTKRFDIISDLKGEEYVLVSSQAKSTEELLDELSHDPDVEYAEPNYIYTIEEMPNDPNFDELWGMNNTGQTGGSADADIDAPEGWDIYRDASSVVIGVLDTGVDYDHEDLAANMWTAGDGSHGYNAITGTTDPMDDHGHGTHCAGTIGAVGDNSTGVAGVCWQVQIMALKFIAAAGSGTTADAVEALEWALNQKLNNGVNLVATSNSWGGGDYSQTLYDMIDLHRQNNIAFINSAGNDGLDTDVTPHYPSSYNLDNVIAVAATDHNDQLAGFSNYGQTSVDLAAPGVSIYSSLPRTYVPGMANDIWFRDMDTPAENTHWANYGSSWAITDEMSHSGDWALSDSPGGNYLNNTASFMEWQQNIDLSGYVGKDIYFGYYMWLDTELGYDSMFYQFSLDGGCTWGLGGGWTGYTGGWFLDSLIIPDAYKTNQFRMRFGIFTNDNNCNYDGVYIDDVGIGTNLASNYGYSSGTSMAAPHVAGAYALLSAVNPGATYEEIRDKIYDNVDELASLNGKMTTGGRLNLYHALPCQAVVNRDIDLRARLRNYKNIILRWRDKYNNEVAYVVQRQTGYYTGVWETIATLPPGTKKYKDVKLAPNYYTYRIIVDFGEHFCENVVSNKAYQTTSKKPPRR